MINEIKCLPEVDGVAEAPTEAQVEVGEEKVEAEGEVGEEKVEAGGEVGAPEKENLSGVRVGHILL
jgi:hypothetical protein